jgi:hypothetical protein
MNETHIPYFVLGKSLENLEEFHNLTQLIPIKLKHTLSTMKLLKFRIKKSHLSSRK